jgi:hypothetical protein
MNLALIRALNSLTKNQFGRFPLQRTQYENLMIMHVLDEILGL